MDTTVSRSRAAVLAPAALVLAAACSAAVLAVHRAAAQVVDDFRHACSPPAPRDAPGVHRPGARRLRSP
ncbi:hypothetical protein [Kineococcus sp. SYSU DK005]|uniref:hypothetical protein n=1 Tax=Kineococcus sp. SYSU DK005 TaxID=3383126 RepID=UPI003D7CB99F